MKILITGAAGFIGFHLAKALLSRRKNKVIGIDNYDNYYSVKLKKLRTAYLKKYKNYKFIKVDLSDFKKLKRSSDFKWNGVKETQREKCKLEKE